MLNSLDAFAAAQEIDTRKFIVNVLVTDDRPPEVRSCEVVQQHFRNRTSFTSELGFRDVFVRDVAAGLEACLTKLSLKEAEVVSFPTLVIESPGLILAGAHVMSNFGKDGSLNIIVRFQIFLGGINHAFKANIGFDDYICNQNVKTSTRVLSDIAMPLLDLSAAAEVGLSGDSARMAEFGKELAKKSRELSFYVELVKRYVDGIWRLEQMQSEPSATTAKEKYPHQLVDDKKVNCPSH
ncbi:hypothetical protein [Pseudophaeobacter flagellatus]|uniref:hypothetical protein n=1 Tax=Pseudophaeobacter flagellatus TaxID=2899119 RepID=UPI001E57655C|nr:hypothetical protein [Pseudophaeobacter flagellatus]MCD9149721.1 hypothetical protein [Pseudophaeobacter flagellatus]